jgi:hypothetical protein
MVTYDNPEEKNKGYEQFKREHEDAGHRMEKNRMPTENLIIDRCLDCGVEFREYP